MGLLFCSLKYCKIKKEMFLSPGHDRVVRIESQNFSTAKAWCFRGFRGFRCFRGFRGFVLNCQGLLSGSTFIHPRFIYSEKRADKIPAAYGLLRPENSRVQEFF